MNLVAQFALLAFVPMALLAFARFRAGDAAALVLAVGCMLMPGLTIDLPGPIVLSKAEAMSFGLLFGVLCFDPSRLAGFRPKAVDLALLGWLIVGSFSSLANSLGTYDAFAVGLNQVIRCGIPYVIGALYFSSPEGQRRVLWLFFLSALVYVPLCLFEVRMSPQLHAIVYGSHQHGFDQTMRGGGYRPMVFMSHGLELSMWLGAATVAGFTLWRHLRQRGPFGLPMGALVAAVGGTLVICKSTGATVLAALGILAVSKPVRRWGALAMLLGVPFYLGMRMFGGGVLEQQVCDLASMVSEERASSMEFRFLNETLLLGKFSQHPWLGAGGWNFGLIFDEEGELLPLVTDSFWIIAIATSGILGMLAAVGSLWWPAMRALGPLSASPGWRVPERLAAIVILAMLVLDSMVNAFVLPVYVALAGGLAHATRATPVADVGEAPAVRAVPQANGPAFLLPRSRHPASERPRGRPGLRPRPRPVPRDSGQGVS